RLTQAAAAVAKAHLETLHLQIFADHLARRRFVIDHDDVTARRHAAGNLIVKVVPGPAPLLSAMTEPPCRLTMRLTMERPRPVELSPAVGLADSRWKRPNSRDRSSGERPGPWSAMEMATSFCCGVTETRIVESRGLYLIALLIRLSIASRMRSASQVAGTCLGPENSTVWFFLAALGWLAAHCSAARAAMSADSLRIGMSIASAMASDRRSLTMSVRPRAAFEM